MSDAAVFAIIFVGFFILRLVAATAFFLLLFPEGDRCPNCDSPTVRVKSPVWNLCLPWFRTSWCMECGWHGLLRRGGELTPAPESKPLTKFKG